MAYIVYITEDCQKEAKKHNFDQDLQPLKDMIEKNQTVASLGRIGSSKYFKKKFGKFQGRLITCEEPQTIVNKEYVVIIFLTIFIRGNNDYAVFRRNPEIHGEKYLSRIDRNNFKKYLEKAIAENPPVSKPPLSEVEKAYLYSAGVTSYDLDNEALIYESDQWVKAINQEPFSSILPRIYDTVKNICEEGLDNINECQISQRNEKIIFYLEKSEKRLSLIDLVTQESSNISDVVEKWKHNIKDNISIIKRAYPQYILADDSLWMDIEKDPQSNFTLSREEIDVLNACTTEKAFPLFINGRAGSGKSTMLQYLFADYFSRYISYKDNIKNPPVYFTYNSELLQRAKNFVKGLIKCNSAFEMVRSHVQQNADIIGRLEDSFKELKVYLLSIVSPSDTARFDNINYVAFTRFHDLWLEKFKTDRNAMHDYSPDISWHVIRTYIQGMDTDNYMDPEDYDELEEKQKTVSREVYQKIYDKVWKWYSEIKQEKKLWDDQDLARYIIKKNLAKPVFPGVFCDEAQDFTRVDMDVIFSLSIYSNRDLLKKDISTIPFAFAGDELQTLNPTGFRWEALKAGFTQKFILSLSTTGKESTQTNLNYRELSNNYRSLPPIVKFCNTLQLFRAIRFNISNLRPQKPWNTPSNVNVPVVYFLANEAVFWEKILKITDTVFIIPCNEGQEVEWIKRDHELSKYITIENDVPTNVRVLSANLAKGLEFNRVVVYGFGMNCPSNMINGSDNEDTSVTLPLEYYINKTYVAISRAKKQLFIVDSEDGIKNLWDVTRIKQLIDNNIEKINTGNVKHWSLDNDLFLLTQGQGYSSLMESSEINMEEIASQFMQNGISQRNSYILRQAANIYKELKQNVEVNKCEAIADVFDKKYLEAGNLFNKHGRTDEAIKAFWLANSDEGYKNIVNNTARNPKYPVFYKIASSMISNEKEIVVNTIKTVATNKATLYDAFKGDDVFLDYDMRNVLMHAINVIVQKINPLIDVNSGDDDEVLYRIIDIQNQGIIKIETANIAEIAYTLNNHELAIEYWDKSEIKDKEKYTISKAYCTKYPDNISLLKSIKKYDEIINQYNKNTNFRLSDEQLFVVAEAFLMNKNHDKALQISSMITSPESYQQLYNINVFLKSDKKYSNIFLVLKKMSIIRKEEWNAIWDIIEDERGVKNKNDTSMILYIAAGLARLNSWSLLADTGHSLTKKDISEFLREEIIKKYIHKTYYIPEEIIIDIGTAIEKAGHRNDALDYYKYAESSVENEELKIKCGERWIKAKERQAEYSSDDEDLADKRKQEAITKRRLYGIPEDKELAEYNTLSDWSDLYQFIIKNETSEKVRNETPPKPEVAIIKINTKTPKSVKTITEKEDTKIRQPQLTNTEFDLYGFKFSYYYQKNRLNITNEADGKTISVMDDHWTSDSDDYSVEEEYINGENYQNIIDTPILFKNKNKIEIYFSDKKIKISFNE
jgi:hypothetical protein